MKKAITSILGIIFAMMLFCTVWAEADQVQIDFKVGSDSYTVNDKSIKSEKSIQAEADVLIPADIIKEAFGAEVTTNAATQSVTLKYNGVEIKLYVGKKEATVDGKQAEALDAPRLVNTQYMIPLIFVADNFAAEVVQDELTGQVTVTKQIAGVNSIKDFGIILKNTTKSTVGDSYYKWTMNLPKELEITYRDFNGSYTRFSAKDENYTLDVIIRNQDEYESLDSIASNELDYLQEYTLLDNETMIQNGEDCLSFTYRDGDYAYEDRYFIKDGRVFILALYVWDYKNYSEDADYIDIMDSFNLAFTKDGKTEDLSDVGRNGFRTYDNKEYKWSILVQPEMGEYTNEDQENVTSFTGEDGTCLYVDMYSLEKGLTLEKLVADEQKRISEEFNPKYVTIDKIVSGKIKNATCKKIYVTETYGKVVYKSCDAYIVGKNYRYHIRYVTSAEIFNDANKRKAIDAMLDSFKFTNPDEKTLGRLIDPGRITLSSSMKKLQCEEYKWSLEMPVIWEKQDDDNGSNWVYYRSKNQLLSFQLIVTELEKSFDEQLADVEKSYINLFKGYTKETIIDKGIQVVKYVISPTDDNGNIKQVWYVINKNNCAYFVQMVIPDVVNTDKNNNILDTIWKSLIID